MKFHKQKERKLTTQ